MSNTTIDKDELLRTLNNGKVRLFAPVFVYIAILMLVGAAGNLMVLYFYGCKNKLSPSTCFILALAVFDLISCLVAMPMEIADLRLYFDFNNLIACRILRFLSHFASVSSGLTLVAIAIDRYRRICHPFERQLNNRHVKVICVVVGVLSAVLSWPAIVFNKIVELNVPNTYNITLIGHDCTTTKENSLKAYVFVTNVVYVVAFVLITLVLSLLYAFIGRQLFRHQKFRYYVARKGTKSMRTTVRTSLLPVPSDDTLNTSRENVTSSDRVFEDPPDATGSVVDLKEFVTRGLTQVESDRPTSGNTAVTGTTGLTGLTGVSGNSKRSRQSIKSVTICEPSQNRIYSIEPADKEPGSRHPLSWPENRERISSASSLATFSSRPSSASLSEYSESATIKADSEDLDRELGIVRDNWKSNEIRRWREMTHIMEEPNETEASGGDGHSHIQSRGLRELDVNSTASVIEEHRTSEQNGTVFEIPTDRDGIENTESLAIDYQHPSPSNVDNTDYHITNDHGVDADKTMIRSRPSSKSSDSSKRSRVSSRSRRSNVVTPTSQVTTTTSLASRASSVRRFQSLLRYSSKSNKMETDTDNVKELRMKMLDLNTMKYTVIMLVITIVFVISFLPYLSLVIWRYFKDEHEVHLLSNFELVMFQIGVRSVFLNSSLNPIIYGGFNSTFRAYFYGIFCKCCLRKSGRKRKRKTRDQSDSTSGT